MLFPRAVGIADATRSSRVRCSLKRERELWLALPRPAHTWRLHRSLDLASSVLANAQEPLLATDLDAERSPKGNDGCSLQVVRSQVCILSWSIRICLFPWEPRCLQEGKPYLAQVNLPFSNGKLTETPPPRQATPRRDREIASELRNISLRKPI